MQEAGFAASEGDLSNSDADWIDVLVPSHSAGDMKGHAECCLSNSETALAQVVARVWIGVLRGVSYTKRRHALRSPRVMVKVFEKPGERN